MRAGPDAITKSLAGWLAVLAILVVVDVLVRSVFAPIWLPRIASPGGSAPHDVTFGRDLSIVFALAEWRIRASPHTVALVGDSTVLGDLETEHQRLAPDLEHALAGTPGQADPITMIDLGFLGLTAPDAAIVVAKALALGSGLVVYAVTPRVACALPFEVTDAVRYALDPGVPARLGLAFLLDEYPVASLAASAVSARWALYRHRGAIRNEIQGAVARRAPAAWRAAIAPAPYQIDLGPDRLPMDGPIWTHARCPLDDDSREMIALRRIFAMCGAEDRCVVYHGPINADALGSFEPGLLPGFRKLVARLASEHRVPLFDYTEALSPESFRRSALGRPDAIHLASEGRTQLAQRLAADLQDLLPHAPQRLQ